MSTGENNDPQRAMIPSLDLDAVDRLLIYHLDSAIRTPVAVHPAKLEHYDLAERFETTDPQYFRVAYKALSDSDVAPSASPAHSIDARWGIIFIAGDGERLLAAYTDAFGVRGVINNRPVSFVHSSLLHWLEERLTS